MEPASDPSFELLSDAALTHLKSLVREQLLQLLTGQEWVDASVVEPFLETLPSPGAVVEKLRSQSRAQADQADRRSLSAAAGWVEAEIAERRLRVSHQLLEQQLDTAFAEYVRAVAFDLAATISMHDPQASRD